jgi:hypothetical protein
MKITAKSLLDLDLTDEEVNLVIYNNLEVAKKLFAVNWADMTCHYMHSISISESMRKNLLN